VGSGQVAEPFGRKPQVLQPSKIAIQMDHIHATAERQQERHAFFDTHTQSWNNSVISDRQSVMSLEGRPTPTRAKDLKNQSAAGNRHRLDAMTRQGVGRIQPNMMLSFCFSDRDIQEINTQI
jgi:N-acetylglutamate synthase/N-acetylornithine aminotransferase